MRAVALVALTLVLAGCASGAAETSGSLGNDAAKLVPPDALAFVNVDTNFDSKQWRAVADVIGPQLDLPRLKAAAGDALSAAVLAGDNGKHDAVAFAKPRDETKLEELAKTYDHGNEHYTVERVGDWSVVADSQDAFAAVRRADSGRSLADDGNFQAAEAALHGNALVTAFADGAAVNDLSGQLGALTRALGSAKWFAAQLSSDGDALKLDVQASSLKAGPAVYSPTLLRDVPSGAIAAVSFKDLDRPLAQLKGVKNYLGVPLARLLPALRGQGALYLLPGTLIPTFAVEVESPKPQAAASAFRKAAARVQAQFGNAVVLRVARYGSRVVLTNAPTTLRSTGGSLLNDQPYKDALAAAGVPDQVTFLAYADVQRLRPILETLVQLLRPGSASPKSLRLDRLGTVVTFGTSSRFVIRASLR